MEINATKTLYLVRHAESDLHHRDLSDFERPLNKRGLKDAPQMGRRLHARSISPALILASPACRAKTTAALIAAELHYPPEKIEFNPRIYEASPQTLLHLILAIDDQVASAMLVGHNPGITLLAGGLTGERIANMPPGAVAAIRLNGTWSEAASAELLDLDTPNTTH